MSRLDSYERFDSTEELEDDNALIDGRCMCGHLPAEHNPEVGCMAKEDGGLMYVPITWDDDEAVDAAFKDVCKCIRTYREDGTFDGFVGDHDGEEGE